MVGLKNSYCRLYEEAIEKLRVEAPEIASEDDDEFLSDLYSNKRGDAND